MGEFAKRRRSMTWPHLTVPLALESNILAARIAPLWLRPCFAPFLVQCLYISVWLDARSSLFYTIISYIDCAMHRSPFGPIIRTGIPSSGLLDVSERGDVYTSDKGVNIQAALASRGAALRFPPRKLANQQFAPDAEDETTRIAKLRVHIERAIGAVRVYGVWKRRCHITELRNISRMMRATCMLVNLQNQPFAPKFGHKSALV